MSHNIRAWLRKLGLYEKTTHEDRFEIDREIERRTGIDCDSAIELRRIDEKTFREIVEMILKKKRKQEVPMVV